MGTGGTRTPLHFDSYDNLFVQLVGAKYVRLYPRDATPNLYVSTSGTYGLQGNMSDVDCEREDWAVHGKARDAEYTEVLLLPGDALFIPARTWHYVRALSTSISVSYWF
jgi:ribosomal protein L16 Arg81 hydroxylase